MESLLIKIIALGLILLSIGLAVGGSALTEPFSPGNVAQDDVFRLGVDYACRASMGTLAVRLAGTAGCRHDIGGSCLSYSWFPWGLSWCWKIILNRPVLGWYKKEHYIFMAPLWS